MFLGDASASVLDMTKKRKNYQNTFKLGPDEKPQMGKIREMMTDVVRGNCLSRLSNKIQ